MKNTNYQKDFCPYQTQHKLKYKPKIWRKNTRDLLTSTLIGYGQISSLQNWVFLVCAFAHLCVWKLQFPIQFSQGHGYNNMEVLVISNLTFGYKQQKRHIYSYQTLCHCWNQHFIKIFTHQIVQLQAYKKKGFQTWGQFFSSFNYWNYKSIQEFK